VDVLGDEVGLQHHLAVRRIDSGVVGEVEAPGSSASGRKYRSMS
jgi:hypothetical protein